MLHLRAKIPGFLFTYNRDRNSGNSVVFFPTVTDFFLFLSRCIPDSLFPYFNFCWSATISFGVFPWSVYIYRRPWSVEACSNVQRYSMNLDYFPFVSKLQKLHKVTGQRCFSMPSCFYLNHHFLQTTLIFWGVTDNFETRCLIPSPLKVARVRH